VKPIGSCTALAYNDCFARDGIGAASSTVKRLRVGVLYGGRSGEHEVSLASAAAVCANLDRQRYEPVAIRIEKDGRWVLADRPPSATSAADVIEQARTDALRARSGRSVFLPPRPDDDTLLIVDQRSSGEADDLSATVAGLHLDVVFPVLHGPFGEDGTIQGLLELADVPYVGCGVLASAVGMDKAVMKRLFRAHGLRVPDWVLVTDHAWREDADGVLATIARTLPPTLFVKPANLGSSVGISKVKATDALRPAIDLALGFDRRVIVEAAVPAPREIECGVLGNDAPEASVPGEITPSREFYDYEAKYLDSGSRVEIPAALAHADVERIRQLAIDAFRAIDGAGLARVDFLLDPATGDLFVNEINTMPGFTTISMFAKLWQASGVDYATLVDRLVTLAIARHDARAHLRTSAI
jgi:D-alanine-D-alanine ligase